MCTPNINFICWEKVQKLTIAECISKEQATCSAAAELQGARPKTPAMPPVSPRRLEKEGESADARKKRTSGSFDSTTKQQISELDCEIIELETSLQQFKSRLNESSLRKEKQERSDRVQSCAGSYLWSNNSYSRLRKKVRSIHENWWQAHKTHILTKTIHMKKTVYLQKLSQVPHGTPFKWP